MHYYTHEYVKKAVTLGKLKSMKHPKAILLVQWWLYASADSDTMLWQSGMVAAPQDICYANGEP